MSGWVQDFNLEPYNTFRLPSTVAYFAEFFSEEELVKLLDCALSKELPFFILGGGSNVLLSQKLLYQCLKNSIFSIQEIPSLEKHNKLFRVGAGEIWDQFVLYTCKQNLYGIENLSMIPGSVGASVVQNIGAYGVEVKDVVVSVEGIWLDSGQQQTFTKKECDFSYRMSLFKTSEFQDKFCITYVTYSLSIKGNTSVEYTGIQNELSRLSFSKKDTLLPFQIRQAVINIRNLKLPDVVQIGNAGSFFKNPIISDKQLEQLQIRYPKIHFFSLKKGSVKISAAWLIDYLGFKEKIVHIDRKFYGVYHTQPLVLVHYQGATGKEILDFSIEIQKQVLDEFGITLFPEVRIFL